MFAKKLVSVLVAFALMVLAPLTWAQAAWAAYSIDSSVLTGTLPDATFPATLPAVSGANLTSLDANDLASGTLPDARFPATLPAASGVNLTALNASNLASGTVALARLSGITTSQISASAGIVDTQLATISTAGKVADTALSSNVPLKNAINTYSVEQRFIGSPSQVSTGNYGLGVGHVSTSTAASNAGAAVTNTLNPASDSTALSMAYSGRCTVNNTAANLTTTIGMASHVGDLVLGSGYSGTVSNGAVFHARNATISGGTLTNQYAFHSNGLSGATNNYGEIGRAHV